MKQIFGLRQKLKDWWGSDVLGLSYNEETGAMTITYPDPRAARRRKVIKALVKSPVTVAIVSGVATGIILKVLGFV